MTDDATTAIPPDYRGRRRRALENACVAFYDRDREPPEEALPADWRQGPEQALVDLATSRTPRVVKLQHLMQLLLSDPGLWDEDAYRAPEGPIRRILQHTLPTERGELPSPEKVVAAMAHLEAVLRDEGGRPFEERHWRRYVAEAGELFGFDLPERTFQGRERCNDDETAGKLTPEGNRVDCQVITAEFQSDRPPSAFSDYVDPENWPRCSSFWQEMTQLTPKTPAPDGRGYDCVFDEVVEVGRLRLRVPLEVGFRARPDLSRVWVRFNIDRNEYFRREGGDDPVPVDVDTGTVSAESVQTESGQRTLVRATKYLHARDELVTLYPRLACDVGWPELMMAMAYRCSPDGPPPAAAAGPARAAGAPIAAPVTAAPAQDTVQRFVEQVIGECQQGLEKTSPAVQRLLRRFTGPTWDPGWINDLLDIGAETTRRYGRVASHLRGLADGLSRAADQRRAS